MIEEPFATGDSIFHRIDPRFRVVGAAIFTLAVALCHEFPALVAALAASLGALFLARLPVKTVLGRLALVNSFILLFWVVLPLTYGGTRTVLVGPLALSGEGLLLAAKLTLKSNAILVTLICCVATMTFATFGHSLSRLKLNRKLVFLLMITYRYVFVIFQEYQKILRSVRIRGFVPRTTLHTYKTFAYVIGMLLIRAAARADRVYDAMRCRGFKGKYYSLAEYHADAKSWIFMGLALGFTLIVIIFEIHWKYF